MQKAIYLAKTAIASTRGTLKHVLPCKAPTPHWTRSVILELGGRSRQDEWQLYAYQDK